ncbi:acyl-CoA thioester hydrolase/N-acetyltransferase [Psychroflexus torquis ATCC 700755]|uniref:Acyl-CoA thioester hydrolase/N-acetyltransferase n=2 Tax=Psychroflexus TaxID=83612 RepID=K4IES7_PSYTT|nr:acyl-CoA thioester hydrolase/N-acetyltransferase [Psychroflexus torquis ATCC 700755]
MLETAVRYKLMKIITIIKSGLKIISATILLIFIPSVLFYSCISSYPSSRVKSQLFNSDTKPCQTLEIKTGKKGTLQVTPNISYSDDIVAIHITGLQPFQIGSLKLSVTDSKDIRWESVACFQANESGEINPENQAPIAGGSYEGKHTMGLFWSLKPEKLSSFHFDTDLNFTISFDTGDGDRLTRTILRKSYENIENHNITKKEIRNKMVANFYLHETDTQRPTLVLLPGSGGNFQHRKAGYIASKGYNVLDLKYFGAKNLPENLENVPLEYLHNAINWLKNKPAVDSSKIALMGRSKGAEYALLYASKYNDVKALVSEVGSSVTWSSKRYIKSPWSYNGKGVPKARGGIRYLKSTGGKAQVQLPYMLSAFEKTKRIEKSSIKIENIKCPILLISGEDDLQWPSTMMSNRIKARAEKYKFNYEIKHYSYENAGHQFDDLPFIPQLDFSNISTWKSGGNFQGNALASIDSWNRIFIFLNKQLGTIELNK